MSCSRYVKPTGFHRSKFSLRCMAGLVVTNHQALYGQATKFFGFATMVDIVGTVFMVLSWWFDSCSCHQTPVDQAGLSGRARRSYWKKLLPGCAGKHTTHQWPTTQYLKRDLSASRVHAAPRPGQVVVHLFGTHLRLHFQ